MQTMNRLFSSVGIIYVDIDTKPPRQDLVDLLNLGGALVSVFTTMINNHLLRGILSYIRCF